MEIDIMEPQIKAPRVAPLEGQTHMKRRRHHDEEHG